MNCVLTNTWCARVLSSTLDMILEMYSSEVVLLVLCSYHFSNYDDFGSKSFVDSKDVDKP